MTHQKEARQIAQQVDRLPGWDVSRTRNGHRRYTAPDGDMYFAGTTPQDTRGFKNLRAWLKRKGANLN